MALCQPESAHERHRDKHGHRSRHTCAGGVFQSLVSSACMAYHGAIHWSERKHFLEDLSAGEGDTTYILRSVMQAVT